MFKSIDFILNEMGKQGIKVIVALVDYWKATDGVQQVGIDGEEESTGNSVGEA